MFCSNCGAKNDERNKFCVSCGKPLKIGTIAENQHQTNADIHPNTGSSYYVMPQQKNSGRNKRVIIIVCAAVLVLLLIVVTAITLLKVFSKDEETSLAVETSIVAERPLSAEEMLDLGDKYLLELNYEQAIVQFTKVIEVEPTNARAYLSAAEAYIGLGETDNAIDILRQGLDQLPDNEDIRERLRGLIVVDANYTLDSVTYDLACLNVPYIKINSNDARRVNEEIYLYFEEIALYGNPNPVGSPGSDDFDPYYKDIDYTYFINDDILSVIIVLETGGTFVPNYEASAYNFNISSGNVLTYEDLANYAGYSAVDALDTFIDYSNQEIIDHYEEYNPGEIQNDIEIAYDANIFWYKVNKMPWFINGEGKLSGFIYSYIDYTTPSEFFNCFTIDGETFEFSAGAIKLIDGHRAPTWFWSEEENESSTQTSDNELLNKLCNGYWVSTGYRLSDTFVYEFEIGVQSDSSEDIEGLCYSQSLSQSSLYEETYILSGNVLTLYYDGEISDTLDYNVETEQFVSRTKQSMVEQDTTDENGNYVEAQFEVYTLTNQKEDPRNW